MPTVESNPHVATNNAREEAVAQAIRPRAGAVLDRPEGELAALWLLYSRLLEREAQARKQSDRKQRREKQ